MSAIQLSKQDNSSKILGLMIKAYLGHAGAMTELRRKVSKQKDPKAVLRRLAKDVRKI